MSSPTGPARPSPPSASTRPRTRCATGAPPACSPTSAGGPIPEYRGTQSLNIIAHASFIGVDHPGRAFIALANLYRHEGIFDDSAATDLKALAPPRYVDRARVLGATLRVVYLLSASMPGVIPKLRWERRDNGSLALVIPASHRGLLGERPAGRLAQLARITGLSLELVAGEG